MAEGATLQSVRSGPPHEQVQQTFCANPEGSGEVRGVVQARYAVGPDPGRQARGAHGTSV
eukprot:3554043-Pleurochrysis_carterae.AAC.1